MHEVMHRWSDGYGASLTFTYLPAMEAPKAYACVTFEDDPVTDVFADARDLRAIAAAALAMADAIEATKATKN